MARLFYVKMNKAEQVGQQLYYTEKSSFFSANPPEVGDYALVNYIGNEKQETLKQYHIVKSDWYLWRVDEVPDLKADGPYEMHFVECERFKYSLSDLIRLNLFHMNVNLLNKTHKSTRGLSFIELKWCDATNAEAVFAEQLKNKTLTEYLATEKNYRSIIVLNDKDQKIGKDIDVKLFRNASDLWEIHPSSRSFIDVVGFDPNQYNIFQKSFDYLTTQQKKTPKAKMYSYLNNDKKVIPSFVGLWDLFYGSASREGFIQFLNKLGKERAFEEKLRWELEPNLDICIDEELKDEKDIERLTNQYKDYIKNTRKQKRDQMIQMIKTALELYWEYIQSVADPLDETQDSEVSSEGQPFEFVIGEGDNRVIYGTPGCGKSYHLKNEILKNFDKENVFRVTFHQDYTYTDFVGQILPIVKDDKVSYRFVPGPFTLALEKAIISKDQKIALVIEELNRGNAASIFGDLFQLLDREGGSSEYELTNVQITDYLNDTKEHKEDEKLHRCGVDYTYGHSYIKLPSNLYIYATMNTGDQNVFTLDTAFKRRWKFEKLSNEFNTGDPIGEKYVPGLKNVTWKTFVETVNRHMIKDGTFDSEDKQLGKYFVKSEMLLDDGEQDSTKEKSKEFAYKVLEYLWNDVAKFDREKWFDTKNYKTLDSIIEKWKNGGGKEIFNSITFAETPPTQVDAAGNGNQS